MGTGYWPLFDLVVETPRLTLHYVDDNLAVELVELAGRGIHDPATMPFRVPVDRSPLAPIRTRGAAVLLGPPAAITPDDWSLQMAIIVDGVTVGLTDLLAKDFPRLRGVADRIVARPRVPGPRDRQGDADRDVDARLRRTRG